jgi:hypothetical protein
MTNEIYEKWKQFKYENIRFLGYGKPHVPALEERVFYAFCQGFTAGRASADTTKQEDRP